MKKTSTKILILILVGLFFTQIVLADSIESITIQDTIYEDFSISETLNIILINNTDKILLLPLPLNARDIKLNNEPISLDGSELNIPLNCENCDIYVTFDMDSVVKKFSSSSLEFAKTISFYRNPRFMNYSVIIPPGYLITDSSGINNLPVVPLPTEIKYFRSNSLITWIEYAPDLPKVYQVIFEDYEGFENSKEEFFNELSEWPVLLFLMVSIILGITIGMAIYKVVHNKDKSQYVPSSLLNPDEKKVLTLLKNHKNIMYQKEIGIQLNWSKSKVSSIISNLYYKKIIEKEKIGRNYKITVIKKVENF